MRRIGALATKPDFEGTPTYRDWKAGWAPTGKRLAFSLCWFAAFAVCCLAIGVGPLDADELYLVGLVAALSVGEFDALRHAGAVMRVERRCPGPRVSPFGSAPWGLIVAVRAATLVAGTVLAAVLAKDDRGRAVLVGLVLFASVGPSWLLEWQLGKADRRVVRR